MWYFSAWAYIAGELRSSCVNWSDLDQIQNKRAILLATNLGSRLMALTSDVTMVPGESGVNLCVILDWGIPLEDAKENYS